LAVFFVLRAGMGEQKIFAHDAARLDCGAPSMAATLRGAAEAAPKIAPGNLLFAK
jgi:hypothetical protein